MEGVFGTPVRDEVWLHPADETAVVDVSIQSTKPLLQMRHSPMVSLRHVETAIVNKDDTIEPPLTEPPQVVRQLEIEVDMIEPVNPDGLAAMELVQPPKKKKLHKQRRRPSWFLCLEGACFRCRTFVPSTSLYLHYKHVPEHHRYEDSPLFRQEDIEEWVHLFKQLLTNIMDYFQLKNDRDLVKFLEIRGITKGEDRSPTWSGTLKVCIERYFYTYGGLVMPKGVTINPPNSSLVLAQVSVFYKLVAHAEPLRRFLNRVMNRVH